VVVVGHDEYWSGPIRDAFDDARAAGVDFAFLGANIGYWKTRYEPAPDGRAARVLVCYKSSFDPAYERSRNPLDSTVRWRDDPVNEPEDTLIGQMYPGDAYEGKATGDLVVTSLRPAWLFTGTGLHIGSRLTGLVGYEFDRLWSRLGVGASRAPFAVRAVMRGKASAPHRRAGRSDVTIYRATSGAWVFSAGTIQWSWGLDGYADDSSVSAAAERLTWNLLTHLAR
jgi:hypothetical protein